jgi:molybdopterin molybdotransferase
VTLQCKSKIAAGQTSSEPLAPATCARIFTGSLLPPGADAIVMQEDVTADGESIPFVEPVKPLENVRLRGEDVRKGSVLVRKGERLTSTRISLLTATGHDHISVHRPCNVALLATGAELVESGNPLKPGQIYESNRAMLGPMLSQIGAQVHALPIVRDDLAATTKAFEKAFATTDAVISIGGVSVGEFDFVKEAFRALGGAVDLWQIAMRPGKPFVFGQWHGKPLFGLPGNPVSAFVTFLLLVQPALRKMQGATNSANATLPGELQEPVSNRTDRRHFLRVRWTNGKVHLAGAQKSHMIGSLAQANALLDVAPGAQLEAGSRVDVLLWELPEN